MLLEILRNVPAWVWLIFAALLALGLLSTRPRRLPTAVVLVLPAAMTALSAFTVMSAFGARGDGPTAWAVGMVAALVFNQFVLGSPAGVRYGQGRFELPGSWLPLALMMTIFCARFAIGLTAAVSPATAAAPRFIDAISAVLGFCSGMFLSRALVALRARSAAGAVPAG